MRIEWNAARNSVTAKRKARRRLEGVFRNMEYEERRVKEAQPKTPVFGIKTVFLQEYEKNGYYSAKKLVNNKFDREVYTDEILISWLGIEQPIKRILDAYKKGKVEDAYEVASFINKKVGYDLYTKEAIDKLIMENNKKERDDER